MRLLPLVAIVALRFCLFNLGWKDGKGRHFYDMQTDR